MTEKCAVIIPVKDASWWTAWCLDELFQCVETADLGEVLVIDDGSAPPASAALRRICADRRGVRLLRNETSLGFGAACNLGAAESGSPYLLFLHADCLPTPGLIRKLIAILRADSRIGLVAPLANQMPGASLPLFPGRSYREMNELLTQAFADASPAEATGEACPLPGCCLLVSRECWNQTGGFATDFGLSRGEEADLQFRAMACGRRAVMALNAYVYHFGGSAVRGAAKALLATQENRRLLAKRHGRAYAAQQALCARNDAVAYALRRLATPDVPEPADVLFLLPGLSQTVGGIHVVVELTNELQRRGLRARFAVLGDLPPDGLRNYREPIFAGFYHFPDQTAFLAADGLRAKAVVATLFTTVGPAARFAARREIPLLYFIQGYEFFFNNGLFYREVAESYAVAVGGIVTSAWLESEVKRHAPHLRVKLLPLGVDRDIFYPADDERASDAKVTVRAPSSLVGEGWGGGDNSIRNPSFTPTLTLPHQGGRDETPSRERLHAKLRVAVALRSAPDKGQWVLTDVLDRLAKSSAPPALTVFAAAEYAPPPFWRDRPDTVWVQGPLDRAGIAERLRACDVLLDASFHEGFALMPLEAMACGATVIAADSGGILQYLRHGENGLVVSEVNKPEKYVQALERLAADRQELARLRRHALQTAQIFTKDAAVGAYENFFRDVLKTAAGGDRSLIPKTAAAAGVSSEARPVVGAAAVAPPSPGYARHWAYPLYALVKKTVPRRLRRALYFLVVNPKLPED
jgi:glycosyltransferase involved in cell wall biosynthesis